MDILFEDARILVCVKPVGLESEQEVPAALKSECGVQVLPVHRLDRNVGGVMVYAKTPSAAAALSRVIQNGDMVKEYVACVHRTPPETGDWEDHLIKDASGKAFVAKKPRPGAKYARLTFSRLTAGEESLVHIRLYTGRFHQIRVQFSSRGYPIVGDHKYGSRAALTAPMLFCFRLRFPHGGKMCSFQALPDWEVLRSVAESL